MSAPQKRRLRMHENCLVEVLRFLDTNSLQRFRFTSRRMNHLITNYVEPRNAQLEMVQLRFVNGLYACKLLPYKAKPQEEKFEDIIKAFSYLKLLMEKTSIRLFNVHYVDLNTENLELFRTLKAECISDLSITGCNFHDTNPQTFIDIFLDGNLKAERYTISYAKNTPEDMFDDRFLNSMCGHSIKMMTLHFCEFARTERQFLPMSSDAILNWFFDQRHELDYRVMSIADLQLDPNLADRLIEEFQKIENPTRVTMVISGQVEQSAENTTGQQVMATGPMPERRIIHKNGKFFFKFGRVSPDRIEFSILKLDNETVGTDKKRARFSHLNDYPPKA